VERTATGEVIVTVELAKDFAEGTEIVSRLERVELGNDVDGDPITSAGRHAGRKIAHRAQRYP
jgi:hypothetical protein